MMGTVDNSPERLPVFQPWHCDRFRNMCPNAVDSRKSLSGRGSRIGSTRIGSTRLRSARDGRQTEWDEFIRWE